MLDLLVNIKNFVLSIFQGINKGLNRLVDLVPETFTEFKNLKTRFLNLESTNFENAEEHLRKGNINDAILRLNIIKKLIAPQKSMQANYYLAWCYFLKGNIEKSLSYLRISSDLDEYDLASYLLEPNPQSIPEDIIGHYKHLSPAIYQDKFENSQTSLHIIAAEMLLSSLRELPANAELLDLGAGVGMNGEALRLVLPHKDYDLTAVENATNMCYAINHTRCYNSIVHKSIENFLCSNKSKYHGIIALGSLSFTQDLYWYLKKIHNALENRGACILVFKIGDETKLDVSRINFVYLQKDLEEVMLKAKLKIKETKLKSLKADETYFLISCTAG
ncbi:hypothetical protein phytr_12250 [Candidatus Phycorickettsia trachydisci]|uniref:Methyltransferase n=1 Tax=Candidatus Phycorickettsia trachydisci TaxID=2115978 RepID=A0A2P1PA61_9RICK|nr:tetratricopeptide repeat protein [Candidatus Phycorickettsia trachydisci]AVP88150.1 hypothetical protein phytr_12250 [Candidatus Phycorickettsia trachydisci]